MYQNYRLLSTCSFRIDITYLWTVLGTTTTLAPCDAWSPWINYVKPWQADGDTEYKTLQQLREDYQFCLEVSLPR